MILTDLQTYLAQNHHASLADLATHFHTDADSLRSMLQRLIRKGRVKALPVVEKCHGCTSCSAAMLEIYEWTGAERSVELPTKCPGTPLTKDAIAL